ncbi:uncharacterized protein FRV6_16549 [Fusarium oxysporum]|uniref:Uncharacterized protein n=1 Tax=Fusarium oxysporum TaxID=5507 RepID=A0A2H3U378_FUSOX|nr:uncharacterized protein FRV6_16549 [Fusarium oxysporum]
MGVFEPPTLPNSVRLTNGIRLILQLNAKDPETFSPYYISLPSDVYQSMLTQLHLPTQSIETTSVVGPFFWFGNDGNGENLHFQIIFRKSDIRKNGKTRGWELMLSYSVCDGTTTGFVKGTQSSNAIDAIRHLKSAVAELQHPLLLPVIFLSLELSIRDEQKQRQAREWLRRLENALSGRASVGEDNNYVQNSVMDIGQISRDLAECQCQVLWRHPEAWQKIVRGLRNAAELFWSICQAEKKDTNLKKVHTTILSRLRFYEDRLDGIQNYVHISIERLNIQRNTLLAIIAQKESKLSLEIAGQQRRLANNSTRDSESMKTLALLGAIFLPGTFLASIFSMSFFNFQNDSGSPVSPRLWVYFAVMIPFTAVVVGAWLYWDSKRSHKFEMLDMDVETSIEKMEEQIMASMQRRQTQGRVWSGPETWESTWGHLAT